MRRQTAPVRKSIQLLLVIAGLLVLAPLSGCAGPAPVPTAVGPTAVGPAAAGPTAGARTAVPPVAGPSPAPASPAPSSDAHAGAPSLGDSLYPGFGNGGYDVQHYTLDLNVHDVATSELDGVTTITAQATQDLSSFNLDFIGFTIEGITVDGRPAEYCRSGQELTITPADALASGETFMAVVTYTGVPEEMESVAIPVLTGWVTADDESFVLSEPDGAANFYPVNDHPLDKATYTLYLTVPKPYQAVANGVLAETVDNGETTTAVWEVREPMASYLTTVDIAQFELETDTAPNGVPIRNYYADGVTKAMRRPFARQGEMLALYSELFGPYPFDVYGSVVMNTETGSALESQTMSIFGNDMIDTGDLAGTELVVAHELSHQWFGDSVSVADWRDIWLNESFATYAEGLWLEHAEGPEALDDWVRGLYEYVSDSHDDLVPPGRPPADDLFNAGVYDWGALCLHALRLEVGDEAFFSILQTYYSRYEGGNVTTDDFIGVAEEISGRDLQDFFDGWLYSDQVAPIPSLELKSLSNPTPWYGIGGQKSEVGDQDHSRFASRQGQATIAAQFSDLRPLIARWSQESTNFHQVVAVYVSRITYHI